jgi:hypothetical protein
MIAAAAQIATNRASARRPTSRRTLRGQHRDQTARPH